MSADSPIGWPNLPMRGETVVEDREDYSWADQRGCTCRDRREQ